MLPNLIVAGVTKGGTTALFRYLAAHPEVCSSSVKETCYFLPRRYGKEIAPLDVYRRQFSHHAGEPTVMESTPGYFYGPEIPAVIDRTLPGVKIVLVFRDPVDRFFSHFYFTRTEQDLPRDLDVSTYLEQCLEHPADAFVDNALNPWFGFEGGRYARYLPPWLETFGDRLHVTFFENFKRDTLSSLQEIAEFAGIEAGPLSGIDFTPENKTRAYGNAALHGAAMSVYRRISPTLNRYPNLKKSLFGLYRRINEVPMDRDEQVEERLRVQLSERYGPDNRRLREQLDALGPGQVQRPFPDWLNLSS